MSAELWVDVAREMSGHAHMEGVQRPVTRIRATGEIFTPTALVVGMLASLPLERFAAGKTILDPACGDGQFLVAAKWVKILHYGLGEEAALRDIYGVDIMRDNVDLCRRRLGGGTIVMGNVLDPNAVLDGQTEQDIECMRRLFAGEAPDRFRLSDGRRRRFERDSARAGFVPLTLGI